MRRLATGLLLWCCAGAGAAVDLKEEPKVEPKVELIVASNEYPPYVSADPKQSFLTELYEQIGKEMGVTFTFRFMPWKRCLFMLEQKQVWGVVPFVTTPERVERYLLSATLYVRRAKFFYYDRGDRAWPGGYRDLGEIKQFKVGGVTGYWYADMFREAGINVDWAINDERNFGKLQAGRFDLTISDENAAAFIIGRNFGPLQAPRFRSLDTPVYLAENFMMVNRGGADAELLARFNHALETVRRTGAYERIVKARQLMLAD